MTVSPMRRAAQAPALAVDAAIAVAAACVMLAALPYATERTALPADALAVALILGTAAPLVVRRRWPLAVLVTVTIVWHTYHVLNYAGGPPNVAFLIAIYTAAASGFRRWSLLVAAAVVSVGLLFRTLVEQESVLFVAVDSALFIGVSLLGDAVHSRRALSAEIRKGQQLAAAERERESQRRVVEERLRIAREMHDVLAHTIAAITVQAGVAGDVLEEDPGQARAALRAIRGASREALTELGATLGALRSDDAGVPRAPAPGLDEISGLIDTAAAAGLCVQLQVTGQCRNLPAHVDLTAYRIVQESLTNVVRHAAARSATVAVRHDSDALLIEVSDDGRGLAGAPDTGYGLAGMAERAAALGGWLRAGADPDGGFRVRACLPSEVQRS